MTKNLKINALEFLDEASRSSLNMVRNLQLRAKRPDDNRIISRQFPLDLMAEMLSLSTKRVRDLVKDGTLQCRSYLETNTIKFTQEEISHNISKRQMLPTERDIPLFIAVTQYKGGTGKTTSAVGLAVYLALSGHRVILVDADPQGTATEQLWRDSPLSNKEKNIKGLDAIDLADTIYSLLTSNQNNTRSVDELSLATSWNNLKLIPSCAMLDTLNIEMSVDANTRDTTPYWNRFRNKAEQFNGKADIVIIDTAPNINCLNLSAVFTADILLMPLMASMPDVSSYHQYVTHMKAGIETLRSKRLIAHNDLPKFIPKLLITNYDGEVSEEINNNSKEITNRLLALTAKNKGLPNKDTYIRLVMQKMLGKFLIKKPIMRSDAVKEAANNFMPVFELNTSLMDEKKVKKFTVTDKTQKRVESSFISFGEEIKTLINNLNSGS